MKSAKRAIEIALMIVALSMAIYQLVYTQILLQDPTGHLITHLGFAFAVVFLHLILRNESRTFRFAIGILLLLSLVVTAYLMIELLDILTFRTSIPAKTDLLIGVLVVALLLVINWLVFGKTFTIVSAVAICYLVFGRYLPPPFTVPSISYQRLLMWISVELGTGKGVYGEILDLSATYLFLFIFFGGVLNAFGGTRFVIGLGCWVGSKVRPGPAMVALLGSSLLGSITGSTVANITITGSYTIPMMKDSGYTAEQAAAIETVSSNGGQITPPILGATAFLMAGFANIPYFKIVLASIVPALLYFICVFVYIMLTAEKMQIQAKVQPVDVKKLLLDSPLFLLPVIILTYLLVKGYSLPYIGFWSIVSVIVIGLIMSALRKEARLGFKQTLNGIVGSIRTASQVALICGLLGVTVSAIDSSGLAVKLPLAIESLSQGFLPLALLITGITSLILGIGLPTPAAYVLVALGAVPTLLEMGVPLLSAHFFCFFFAISSHITPPVAIGSLVASQMAGSDYWKTCWEAVKAAFAKYLLPIFFIYTPVIILQPDVDFVRSLAQVVAILMLIISLQISVSMFCFYKVSKIQCIAFIIASMFFLAYTLVKAEFFLFLGLALFAIVFLQQFITSRKKHALNVSF